MSFAAHTPDVARHVPLPVVRLTEEAYAGIACRPSRQYGVTVVGRAIVEEEQFPVGESLGYDGANGFVELFCIVIDGD